jgi:phosphatidylserine/phosphatidylglycerophosphate/cardiolipin synthase-like enzyme
MATPPKTQQKSVNPLSDASCSATGSLQWHLENNEDEKTPVFHYNNLSVYICGEDGFKRIAEDIRTAEKSIDIVCWGFDPAMELTRSAGPWKRGDTFGDLLRDAAEGKLESKKKIQVRLLAWYDALAVFIAGSNMPGYKTFANFERNAGSSAGMAAAHFPGGPVSSLPEPVRVQDQREVFNARWYRDVAAGKIEGLSLRTRSGVHEDVLAELKAEARERGATVTGIERLGLERLATHHQKTIVIDYEGTRPRAYVMGLNSVTDYWDSQDHAFNDPRRGQNFEGGAADHSAGQGWDAPTTDKTTLKPYQDFACRLEGDALVAVYKNFAEAWNAAKAEGKGVGSPVDGEVNLKAPPKRLTQNLTVACSRAQIVRTLPKKGGGERSIERLYYQASSFARHYLYIENQYVQNADWARALKVHRQNYVQGCTTATPPVPMASIPVLHVMVVMPTPERGLMVPRTHDTVTELGHGDSMPNQDRNLRQELEQQEKFERDTADYKRRRQAHEARRGDAALDRPYAAVELPPNQPLPLSALAQSYKAAGGSKQSQATRDLLSQSRRMRTLVASLWAFDDKWSRSNLPVARRIDEEKQRYVQDMKTWKQRLAAQAEDRARSVNAGGWSTSTETPIPPAQPPDRSKELKNAMAQRYREVYIHSKLMIIDDSMFTLGSANLNLRSFAVDSEINIASDDALKAKDLRQRVWKQHTKGQFDGAGDATDQEAMSETFRRWEAEASANADKKAVGDSLSSFLVKFLDERTSSVRAG